MTLRLRPRAITKINYSYLFCLPKEWLDFHKMGQHDKVDVTITDDEDGRALIIRPIKKEKIEMETKQVCNECGGYLELIAGRYSKCRKCGKEFTAMHWDYGWSKTNRRFPTEKERKKKVSFGL